MRQAAPERHLRPTEERRRDQSAHTVCCGGSSDWGRQAEVDRAASDGGHSHPLELPRHARQRDAARG